MFSVIVSCGTYDGSVFASEYIHRTIDFSGPKLLKPLFVDPTAHTSPVTSVATKDSVVLSGSSDEIIQVFSIHSKARLGALEMHVGTIRQLKFTMELHDSAYCHLFSASDDGCIGIWRCEVPSGKLVKCPHPSAWECIRQMRRHKGPVQSIAVHPSNRCLFSISADKTFRVWNLLRGRQAYAIRLKNIAEGASRLSMSPTGNRLLFIWPDKFNMVELASQLRTDTDVSRDGAFVLGNVQFSNPPASDPIFFSEDDELCNQKSSDPLFAYVLVGIDASLTLIKFNIRSNSSKPCIPEITSKVLLPGKRIKFIEVLHWPSHLVENEPICLGRSRLVIVVTTDGDGSHIRGYAVNLNSTDALEPGKSFIPLFTYDVPSTRITALAATWTLSNYVHPLEL
ncbi:p21-activated protein kinase-interacting protein [Schistosoma japonicum]|uniref:PAK1-interacting protein 1-like n=1 Tax=Schistosoma japonicum TaxID=6182 RepID=C1L614_SCHJA|nr:F-box/WD repeat-containing protein pof1 [Schistosoma japonicum]KAH8863756.1 F-box/WD repeat-containing protein pof1 [Schistosoma japonicum]KAH8863757.1 F-box/WD repeat-containing protein pof1 [Schistosoma japonicum]KAH8863758.1 F-box/WD repeat-containing protein pof1 [Schistosoma japonicum]KAH8863759.1 F-box/WD repeat-containing protein pof1 [Schistosoma japonicum]